MINMSLRETRGNSAQRGKYFAQRGMDFIPGGIVYSLFSSRYGEIEFEYNKDDKNKL
jgi:hypothetical protein